MSTLGPFPYESQRGFYWKPNGWKVETVQESNGSNSKEIFLDKIKPLKVKFPKQSKSRF